MLEKDFENDKQEILDILTDKVFEFNVSKIILNYSNNLLDFKKYHCCYCDKTLHKNKGYTTKKIKLDQYVHLLCYDNFLYKQQCMDENNNKNIIKKTIDNITGNYNIIDDNDNVDHIAYKLFYNEINYHVYEKKILKKLKIKKEKRKKIILLSTFANEHEKKFCFESYGRLRK